MRNAGKYRAAEVLIKGVLRKSAFICVSESMFYFFSAAMLSFKAAIFVSASACFLRSISITLAGALLTNFSLPSFFNTLCKNPS